MKFMIVSEVNIPGIGWSKYQHEQEFDDDSNVFGRVLEYHQYMEKLFPGCEFKTMKAWRI